MENLFSFLTRYVDLYCERTASGFFAEPLNLLSNASFFVAFFVVKYRYRNRALPRCLRLAHYLMFAIGVGSSAFHATARMWGQIADVLPISLFVLFCLFIYLRWARNFGLGVTLLAYAWLFSLTFAAEKGIDPMLVNGSQTYFGIVGLLAVLVLDQYFQRSKQAKYFAAALGFFVLSLFFRSIDMPVCGFLPIGTHYFWHILNGCVVERIFTGLAEEFATRSRKP